MLLFNISVVCYFCDINGHTLLKYPPEYTAYFFEPPCMCVYVHVYLSVFVCLCTEMCVCSVDEE